mmetsp:Transcript_11335/g.20962  ORF Transcript_11335/g.20962 Transcript_11335/m.20962 type:complete len:362 (+) Transcript_11335:151-1236(+)
MRVLFFGSDAASTVALRGVHGLLRRNSVVKSLDVVCPTAKWQGRGGSKRLLPGPAREFAEGNGLGVFDAPPRGPPPKMVDGKLEEPDENGWVPTPQEIAQNYDLGVVVSFGYFLPRAVIEAFPRGAINLHPSLLPLYRGAAPIQRSLINGDVETGVSIIKVNPASFDSGEILHQVRSPISYNDTYDTLSERLLNSGTDALLDVIENYEEYSKNAIPQTWESEKRPRRAPKVTDKVRHIKFEALSAEKVWNRWRGLTGNGGIFSTTTKGKRILFQQVRVATEADLSDCLAANGESFDQRPGPGELLIHKVEKRCFVGCQGNTALELLRIQPEGKKSLSVEQFVNGYCMKGSPPCFQNNSNNS